MMSEGFRRLLAGPQDAALQQSTLRANTMWPRLRRFAPHTASESLTARPDVAGRYDPATNSVLLNRARRVPLTSDQTTGLIGLERARALLASPLGKQWTDHYPLSAEQKSWWENFYLLPGIDAPNDPLDRERILKSTLLSRQLVGDTLPEGAPSLTTVQEQIADLLRSYARQK